MILSIDPIDLNIAAIIRATRKQFGYSQIELAKKLNLTQSTYSRAENCKSLFNVFQWDDFCGLFELHHHSYKFGYIDQMSFKNKSTTPNHFVLPKRYVGNDITAQEVLPTLQFFAQKLGRETLVDMLKSYGIDPDFFTYRFNRLSVQLQIDVTKYLIQTNTLNKDSMPELAQIAATPFSHGSSYQAFESQDDKSAIGNIKTFLELSNHHQSFSTLQIENQETNIINLKRTFKTESVDKNNFKFDSILGNYFCEYLQGHMHQIAKTNLHSPAKIYINHSDCFFKGAKECKYQIRVA